MVQRMESDPPGPCGLKFIHETEAATMQPLFSVAGSNALEGLLDNRLGIDDIDLGVDFCETHTHPQTTLASLHARSDMQHGFAFLCLCSAHHIPVSQGQKTSLSRKSRSWNVLSREPSADRVARSCRHTAPDQTIKTEVKDRVVKS